MTVYGYKRVSKVEQAGDNRSSLETQERVIRGAALMRSEEPVVMFCDPGVSGTVPFSKRPSGAELSSLLRRGDVLIVAKLDRIFRDMEDAVTTAKRLRNAGIGLILCDIGNTAVTETGVGQLQFNVMAAVAEFDRCRMLERVAEGKRGKKARGGHAGGSAPYGQRIVGSGREARLMDEPGEIRVIETIVALHEGNATIRAIAAELSAAGYHNRAGQPFAPAQVHRIVKRLSACRK